MTGARSKLNEGCSISTWIATLAQDVKGDRQVTHRMYGVLIRIENMLYFLHTPCPCIWSLDV